MTQFLLFGYNVIHLLRDMKLFFNESDLNYKSNSVFAQFYHKLRSGHLPELPLGTTVTPHADLISLICLHKKSGHSVFLNNRLTMKISYQEVPVGINLSHHTREEQAQEEKGEEESGHRHKHDPSLEQR